METTPQPPEESPWCEDCKRLRGVGCSCYMSFGEKVKTVAIDKSSLKDAQGG